MSLSLWGHSSQLILQITFILSLFFTECYLCVTVYLNHTGHNVPACHGFQLEKTNYINMGTFYIQRHLFLRLRALMNPIWQRKRCVARQFYYSLNKRDAQVFRSVQPQQTTCFFSLIFMKLSLSRILILFYRHNSG